MATLRADTTERVLHLGNSRLSVLWGHVWEKTSHNNEDEEESQTEEDELGHGGMSGTVVTPLFAESPKVLLELISSELVVNETPKRNAVAEELEGSNGIAEDEHGSED
jgi:hypothetical protein